MTLDKVYAILNKENLNWRRVNTLPCVHIFYNDLYINLSFGHPHGKKAIFVNVDDLGNYTNGIFSKKITEENEYFTPLLKIYNKATSIATNIAA